MGRRFRVAAVAVATGLVAMGVAHAWSLFPPQPTVGKPAPKFTAVTFGGAKVSLDDYQGQVLVVNVWATWCGPCRTELPLLNGYYEARQQYGLRVIAVTTEDSVPDAQLKPLAKALSFPLIHDMKGPYADLGALPTNFVIDRAGVVRYAEVGAFDLDKLNKVLMPLLKEAAPADPAPVQTISQTSPAPSNGAAAAKSLP